MNPSPAPEAPLRVLYVGRLSSEKGVDVLLRAWALLIHSPSPISGAEQTASSETPPSEGEVAQSASTDKPPSERGVAQSAGGSTPSSTASANHSSLVTRHLSLTIVGDGPERLALEALAAELGISDQVKFTGALPHDKALAVLKTASLLVLPSICYEQFAITPLEAMTFGVPTLTSDVARYGTIIEKGVTGQFFATGDPEALADALRDLLSVPDVLRRMGEAARVAFQKSDCIPSRNLSRLLSIYASCGAPTQV